MESTQNHKLSSPDISDNEPVANCDRFPAPIENRILNIRGKQIIIDRDLAELYGVETKVLNQAVKRNIERFPEHFRFQLSNQEKDELVTICDRFLIIDEDVYHIGHSLKDLGKKLFAFSKMDVMTGSELISQL